MGRGRALVVTVLLAGCGRASVSSSDVDAFQHDVTAALQALDTYQAATHTMSSAADCTTAVNGYANPMQGELDHMMSLSGTMDESMRSMGRSSRADVTCGLQGMADELRHHLREACHETDMEHNREEAARHITVMASGLEHMQMRAAEVSVETGHRGMTDGGWRMRDGGMMGGDDHPAGCPGGPMTDGGVMPGGPGPMMDGGTLDAGHTPMMDGGMGHMP